MKENGNVNGHGQVGSVTVKRGLAQMLKGGVIMDVVTPEHARIAEEAGAVAVMALELSLIHISLRSVTCFAASALFGSAP